MATLSVGAEVMNGGARTYEQARKVGFTFTSVDDGDTFDPGIDVLSHAWESATADTGEVCWNLSRTTGLITADCAAAGNVGTLWIFYGASGRAV